MKNLLPGSTQAVKGWGCLSSFPGIRDMRAHSKTPAVVSKIETIGIIPRTRNATWARPSPSLYYLISLRTQSGLGLFKIGRGIWSMNMNRFGLVSRLGLRTQIGLSHPNYIYLYLYIYIVYRLVDTCMWENIHFWISWVRPTDGLFICLTIGFLIHSMRGCGALWICYSDMLWNELDGSFMNVI